jgi:seryl-tRNA synthetase
MFFPLFFFLQTVAQKNSAQGYYLKGAAVALELALVTYAQQYLLDRNATFLSPPLFMRKEVMSEVAQLSQFADELYKVTGKASEREDDAAVDEKFLIATSEQPIAAYHRGDRIDLKDLPIRCVCLSRLFVCLSVV